MNISNIPQKNLCTGCGTCVGMCPENAIKMSLENGILIPKINQKKCVDCSICYYVCPGHSVEFEGETTSIGKHKEFYVGYAKDHTLRENGSSGGVITSLLVSLLEKKIIDGAVLTKMDGLKAVPFIAKKKDEIINSMGSKYCPVATNQLLSIIKKNKDKVAIVGLPCHIHGIRKAQAYSKDLVEKIVFCFSLMCTSTTFDYYATKTFLKKKKIDNVKKINYRFGKFPPSYIEIKSNDGLYRFTHLDFFRNLFGFYPLRCLTCIDSTGFQSDISFGSAWPSCTGEKKNGTLIISRTERGEKLLQETKSVILSKQKSIECPLSTIPAKKSRHTNMFLQQPKYSNINLKMESGNVRFLKNFILDFKKIAAKKFRFLNYLLKDKVHHQDKKIAILNCPNTENYGSMMMAENTIRYITKYNPDLKFVLVVEDEYDFNRIKKVISTDNIEWRKNKWTLLSKTLSKLIPNHKFFIDCINKYHLPKTINDCQAAIIIGGDNFATYNKIGILSDMMKIRILKIKKVKVFLLGQTIQLPKNFIIKYMITSTLKKVEKIYHRDILSLKQFQSKNSILSSDLALLDLEEANRTIDFGEEYFVFVVSSAKSLYTNKSDKEYSAILANVIDEVCNLTKLSPVIVSHSKASIDKKLVKDVSEKVNHKSYTIIEDLLPNEMQEVFKKSNFVISQRMHGVLSSLNKGIPAIAIAYSNTPKYDGVIGKTLNLPNLIVKTEKKTFEDDIKYVLNVVKNIEDIKVEENLERAKDIVKNHLKEISRSI